MDSDSFLLYVYATLAAASVAMTLMLPNKGPSAFIRDRVLEGVLSRMFPTTYGLRDGYLKLVQCRKCVSVWVGLALGAGLGWWTGQWWAMAAGPSSLFLIWTLETPERVADTLRRT